MPSFYDQGMPAQQPPTPPYTGLFDQPRYHDPLYDNKYHQKLDSFIDFAHAFPGSVPAQQSSFQRSSHCGQSLPPISAYFDSMGAPILPPLRGQEYPFRADEVDYYRASFGQPSSNRPAQVPPPAKAPKEEQATGGVSAKLDYEMDRMTDFVSQAAQGIISPGTPVQPQFRKWVSQVLTATRLPSSTILLSLHYLTLRMRNFPTTIQKTESALYRLLTVSMILGSKFLDDNTFINRSWSDVTSIKVAELNVLEIEWLALIGFDLHVDSSDPNGVSLWIRAWKEYDARAAVKAKASRLSPLNTRVQHHKSPSSGHHASQPGYVKTAHGTYTPLSSGSVASSNSTPYVTQDPWNPHASSTSDFWSSVPRYGPNGELLSHGTFFPQMPAAMPKQTHQNQYSLPPLHTVTPTFYSPWNSSPWDHHHGCGCQCMTCSRQSASHMLNSSFAPQTVFG